MLYTSVLERVIILTGKEKEADYLAKIHLKYVRASGKVLTQEELEEAISTLRARRNRLIAKIIDDVNSGDSMKIWETYKRVAEYNRYGETLSVLVDFANSYELPNESKESRE